MTTPRAFIPKENFELPDTYAITVHFVTGKREEFEIASHRIVDTVRVYCINGDCVDENSNRYRMEPAPAPFLEYVTKEDVWGWIPLSSIQRLEFDKRFSKILEIKQKDASKEALN